MENSSLGEELPQEIKRVKEILEIYSDPLLKGAGNMAAAFMQKDILYAEQAIIEQDISKMIIAYKTLKDYSL